MKPSLVEAIKIAVGLASTVADAGVYIFKKIKNLRRKKYVQSK